MELALDMAMDNRHLDWDSARKRLAAYERALQTNALDDREQMQRIYRLRAEQLALASAPVEAPQGQAMLVFGLAGARFGLPLTSIAEVISHPKIAPVPGATSDVVGVIQVRGEVRVVWNLHTVLELGEAEANRSLEPQVVLMRRGTHEIGLLADSIEDTLFVRAEDRRLPSRASLPGSWITADFLTVLNPEGLFDKLQDSHKS
jgi:chemotaxis signal transduction protein